MESLFKKMDTNHDGVLSQDELKQGFAQMGLSNPQKEAERILNEIDLDQNGFIEFSEWVTASIDKKQMIESKRLIAAFNMFDRNKTGTITEEEILELVGGGGDLNEKTDLKIQL